MGKFSRLGNDLYEGNVSVDFVHRPWRWYALSGIFIVLAFTGLFFRGLNLGVEFQGGTEMCPAAWSTKRPSTKCVPQLQGQG